MAIKRLNHAVLFVSDADASANFYSEVLGFRRVDMGGEPIPGAIFMQAPDSTNDHDLGLFSVGGGAQPSSAGHGSVGLYHLAWEVDTLDELHRLAARLSERGALGGASDHGTTKSLYGKDPDGLEFEVAWIVPARLLDEQTLQARKSIRPLDIEKESQRYGSTTVGGVGISSPEF